jgi:DNA-binding MarR family transcriptional regulator
MARRRELTDGAAEPLHCTPRDSVDALLSSWSDRRADLDFGPVAVVARLARVRAHLDGEIDGVLAAHGLSAPSFAVLVTLARVDDGGGVTQRRLMEELGLTSGTVSVRMDRLVRAGLVDRRPDPASARNTLISLTDAGRELFERVVPAHLDNERRLLRGLSDAERDALAGLLRKLLVEFEGSAPPAGATVGLGLTLAPAHVAATLRAAVGLPAVTGLLVRAVADDGPAAAAGLRTGDVLTAGGRRPLRSVADLYAAIDDAAAEGRLRLGLIRGTEQQRATVRLDSAAEVRGEQAASAGRSARGEHRL